MKPYQTPLEEVLHGKTLAPTVVIGITDNESGKDEEKIHSQVSVIESFNNATAGKSISLEHVVPYNHQGGYATQSVKKVIMRFRVCENSFRGVVRDP